MTALRTMLLLAAAPIALTANPAFAQDAGAATTSKAEAALSADADLSAEPARADNMPEIGSFGFDEQGMDRTIRPGDDFYGFANGKWAATTEIPADKSNYGMFTALADLSQERVKTVLEEAKSDPQSKIGRAYSSYLDTDAVEAKGLAPIQPWLGRIDALQNKGDYALLLVDAAKNGVRGPVAGFVGQDDKNPNAYVFGIYQSGLGLPDRDYYLSTDAKLAAAKAGYEAHIARMFTLAGEPNGAARAKAIRMGWRGALYAWESADTGEEATPERVVGPDRKVVDVLSGTQEQHISADVAYAVWQYWQATGDETFLLDFGAEVLLETARFWASRAKLEADGRHHIRGVIGPDEYHENIDDNAFTNLMARWNIERGLEVAELVGARWPERWTPLSSRLRLADEELAQWRTVAEAMATGVDSRSGLIEQFSGFFGLEKINLADYAGRSVPMDVVLGRERTQRSQVVKQADVVALLALLPDQFVGDAAAQNFHYYEPRCGHGSSLSRAMHGLAAARLGKSEMALRYFHETAAIDLTETHAAIAGGVHIAALGGVWQMAVFGFGGLSIGGDAVAIDPKLPASWRSLAFSIQWRGRQLRIRIAQAEQSLDATLEAGEPMTMVVCGKPYVLRRDGALHVALRKP
mgnify:CR=1 FL=1